MLENLERGENMKSEGFQVGTLLLPSCTWVMQAWFRTPWKEGQGTGILLALWVLAVELGIQHHTSGMLSRTFFLRKSSIFIVLIYSGSHNNLTVFWHHLSSGASWLLCWDVISFIFLHLPLCHRSWLCFVAPTSSIVPRCQCSPGDSLVFYHVAGSLYENAQSKYEKCRLYRLWLLTSAVIRLFCIT